MKIVSDIDEVVVQYIQGFCDFYNDLMGARLVGHGDFETFSFAETLGISQGESDRLRDEYMRSQFFDNMKLVDGAREGIERLAEKNDVSFVTVRPDSHRLKTRDYFDRMFPGYSFDIYFEDGCKHDKIVGVGADVVIEDSVESLKYAEGGLPVVLLDRKWNRGLEHENIYRCFNWGEIVENVERLANV